MDEPRPSPGAGRQAAALFAAVALLAIGALALTQELRSRPDVVNTVCVDRRKCPDHEIRFRLTEDDAHATVAIVDSSGHVVAEPIGDEPLAAGVVRTEWDGKVDATGAPAEPGSYRVRFSLGDHDRRAFLPGKIRIGESR